jgi:hypothetical protein
MRRYYRDRKTGVAVGYNPAFAGYPDLELVEEDDIPPPPPPPLPKPALRKSPRKKSVSERRDHLG